MEPESFRVFLEITCIHLFQNCTLARLRTVPIRSGILAVPGAASSPARPVGQSPGPSVCLEVTVQRLPVAPGRRAISHRRTSTTTLRSHCHTQARPQGMLSDMLSILVRIYYFLSLPFSKRETLY